MARNTTSEERTEVLAGTRIKGKLHGAGDVLVSGRVEGSVALDGHLIVDGSGVIKAEVEARKVSVAGIVVGDITAHEMIELTAQARVQGDLRAPSVRIDEGARLSGLLEVGEVSRTEIAPRPAAVRSESDERAKPAVAGFVPAPAAQDERRRKRVVVKKRS